MVLNQPLHSLVYRAMAERIRSGEWAEGHRLPSERALIEEFGTSRGPVRQALARLRAEGLIAGGPGAPPRVQKAVPSQSFDTYISFTEWAEELGHRPGRKTIEIARKLADAEIAQLVDGEIGDPVVIVRRLRMFDDDPVMLELGYYPMPGGQFLLSADLDENSIYQVLREQDIVPTRAYNVIDAVAADDFSARWLGVDVGSPLLRLRRASYDAQGKVVDFVDNHYLPGKANFAIENTRHNRTPIKRVRVDSGE